MWFHNTTCFEECTLKYDITWYPKAAEGNQGGSSLITKEYNQVFYHTIDNLRPDETYTVELIAYCEDKGSFHDKISNWPVLKTEIHTLSKGKCIYCKASINLKPFSRHNNKHFQMCAKVY